MITGYVQTVRGKIYEARTNVYDFANLVSLFDNVVCVWKVRLKK